MWNVGGGVNSSKIYEIILKLNQIKPNTFTATYDCYNILKWMGGRPFLHVPKLSLKDYIKKIQTLNLHKIGVYHVFSNYYISSEHLKDRDCNYLLEQTHAPINGVICANNTLVKYVRENYPYFKILGSCTIENRQLEELKKLQDIYDILILPPSLNKSYDIIGQLDPSRLEIMVSENCYDNCKVRKLHYSLVNKWNLSHDLNDLQNYYNFFYKNPDTCFNRKKNSEKKNSLHLNKQEIEIFTSMGVKLFKLQERYDEKRTIKNILKFVINNSDDSLITKYKMYSTISKREFYKNILNFNTSN